MMKKRFYKQVEIKKAENGYNILLDGRRLKTPSGREIICNKNRAEIIAREWQQQGDEILPLTMPCTRLMNVAIERTPDMRAVLIDEFVKYAKTDLLCYRADGPSDLAERQNNSWQKYLDWAGQKYAVKLNITTGINAISQPEKSLENARELASGFDDINLTLLVHFCACFGSAILALAVMDGFANAGAAFDISRLDEIYQNGLWGIDEEAAQKAEALRAELEQLERLI